MVSGRYVRGRDGARVWREWAPQACPVGHTAGMLPSWGACPACGGMGRIWRCKDEGCDEVTLDPDHQHGAG
jgi:RecJ-like exonuclease